MGIVIAQSFKNTVSTYFGFGIGAVNTLFLYTNFLSDEYYGLVAFVLSAANIMMPIMAFGVHNAIVKFYSSYNSKQGLDSFLTLMIFLPLAVILPIGIIGCIFYDVISGFLTTNNEIVKPYIWPMFAIAVAMAYFEVFYAWSKVQLQTVFGNVMKEVFHRVLITVLLCAVYFNWLTASQFIYALVVVYALRMVLMKLYAFILKPPRFRFLKIANINQVLTYASLMVVAGSVAMIILDIDKFMLGLMLPQIENVAYYSVAIFIATVIAVPQRAMHQIMMPLTAQYLNTKAYAKLSNLYERSSLNLLIISGLVFLLIVLNINELYQLLPEQFTGGLIVVLVISIAKLYDNALGNNNAILFNSDYYRMVLLFGIFLTLATILFNLIFIPLLGINGSAIATFLAISIYNTAKVIYVKRKFSIIPFTQNSLKVVVILVCFILLFYPWDFPFHPILNIVLKSFLVTVLYGFFIYTLKISDEMSQEIKKLFKLE